MALLIGAGISPKDIAAITFTEAAAAELLERIESIVKVLLSGATFPFELAESLPSGLTEEQRSNLENGTGASDEITCTTIHGFCQQLISPTLWKPASIRVRPLSIPR